MWQTKLTLLSSPVTIGKNTLGSLAVVQITYTYFSVRVEKKRQRLLFFCLYTSVPPPRDRRLGCIQSSWWTTMSRGTNKRPATPCSMTHFVHRLSSGLQFQVRNWIPIPQVRNRKPWKHAWGRCSCHVARTDLKVTFCISMYRASVLQILTTAGSIYDNLSS